jgi:hypothetical protein
LKRRQPGLSLFRSLVGTKEVASTSLKPTQIILPFVLKKIKLIPFDVEPNECINIFLYVLINVDNKHVILHTTK